ncbi:MAG: helix-turn-helix domain-containing protein [Erysipelotrichaceae bacterium]|nr:helix-turn-helix domain-containing protein [Erysipelotrichaceae bacterium]
MSIGTNIKKYRNDKGISQRELERLTGIDHSRIAKYENDKSEPNKASLERIANALEVPVSKLYDDSIDWSKYDKMIDLDSIREGATLIESIQHYFNDKDNDAYLVLEMYYMLNEEGRKKAFNYLYDLCLMKKYSKEEMNENDLLLKLYGQLPDEDL